MRSRLAADLAVLDGDQLREDADGDLLRRDGADVEADRRVDALQQLGRHAVRGQRVVDARHLGAAADQAEIAQVARRQRAQRFEIVGVAARDDDDVGVRRKLRVRASQAGMSSTTTSVAVGKRSRLANFSRSSTTWTRKPTSCGEPREVEADVAGADDVELGRRLDRLDVDVHLAAADQSGLLGEVVGQLVVHELRLRALVIASRAFQNASFS